MREIFVSIGIVVVLSILPENITEKLSVNLSADPKGYVVYCPCMGK